MKVVTDELANLCGVSTATISYWARHDVIVPLAPVRRGTDTPFGFRESVRAYACAYLRRRHVGLKTIRLWFAAQRASEQEGLRPLWPLDEELPLETAEFWFRLRNGTIVPCPLRQLAVDFKEKLLALRGVRQMELEAVKT